MHCSMFATVCYQVAGLAPVVEAAPDDPHTRVSDKRMWQGGEKALEEFKMNQTDVVMYGGMDATAGPMAKQMKQLGMKSTLLAGDGVCSPEFIKLAGNAADIMKCSNAGEAVEKLAKGADFVAKYKKRFNTDVQVYSPYSYDAVYVIVEAMKKAGKADRGAITTALRDTNYDGLTGKIAFDAKGDIKDGAISMFEVKDGKLAYVSTVR